MRKGKGQVGAGHQNAWFAGGGAAGEHADAAIGESQEKVLGVSDREPRCDAEGDAGGGAERTLAQQQSADRLRPEAAKDFAVAHGAGDEAQIVDLQDVAELLFGEEARGGGAMAVLDDCGCQAW